MEPVAGVACRGVRGAITLAADGPDAVREATTLLLAALVRDNDARLDDIAAAIFTVPDDLAGANPAAVARDCGWNQVPLLMVREHGRDSPVPRCLRVLLLWNTRCPQADVRHAYLRGAAQLRPDLPSAQKESE